MILIRLSLLILETMFLIFISILTILLLVLLFDFAHEGNYQHYLYLYVPIIITAMINIYLIYFYMKIYKEIVSKFKNVDYEIKRSY